MSGRYVRQSSFRHVFGSPAKPEGQFLGVAPGCNGDGDFICANEKFLAYAAAGGGGPVVVLPLNKPGRLPAKIPMITVHRDKVLDHQFHPFLNTLLATASEDGYVKVSQIPEEGLTENIEKAIVTLEGHSKKVALCKFHPTANNVLASGAHDTLIKIWDIEAQTEAINFEDHGGEITSIDWNADGSQLATTCKDKKIRVFDPRDGKSVQSVDGFAGPKRSSVVWASNHEKIIGVGSSKTSTRQFGVWDPKKLDAPLAVTDIDQSAGVLLPFYDPDNSILYIAGKGDASIRYFELVKDKPYLHALSEFRDTNSQQGVAWLPKRACDTTKCEIAVCLRLMKDSIVPISFQVPRKSDLFQKDLFPDAYAGAPSMEAKEYFKGENRPPKLKSMKPGTAETVVAKTTFSAKKSPQELQDENDKLKAKVAELEAELAKLQGR
jgi:coronin-1B/1C/6